MQPLELLSGDAQTFKEKVWASHVLVHHTDSAALTGLLSLDDVDHLLTSVALRTPALRIAQDGEVLPSTRFTRSASISGSPLTGLVDARKVLDLYDGGATVVLQGLHRYWPPLTDLVRRLELELGHPCQANAYLTPPGAQGFARHRDSHDVFVFQTSGHKHWTVGEPGEDADGPPEREVLLEPGMAMYLPTGTPHSARSQDVASLHVTVGINQLTWRSLLTDLTRRVLDDPAYDAPLPAGYVDDPDVLTDALGSRLAALAGDLSALDPSVMAAEQGATFLTERTPALAGGLRDRVLLADLGDDSRLTRRNTAACVLRVGDSRLRVLLGDRELRMPPHLAPAMAFVRDQRSFRVSDIPGLDPQSRLVLARRLVREGLLTFERADR